MDDDRFKDVDLVEQDVCPQCGGELDTGWECNECGFDAQYIANGYGSTIRPDRAVTE